MTRTATLVAVLGLIVAPPAGAQDAPARRFPLEHIFLDRGPELFDMVKKIAQDQAAQKWGMDGGPKYKSTPAVNANPNRVVDQVFFVGVFFPREDTSQLAIFSDDGCDVWINGEQVLFNYGKGQHLPDTTQSLHPLKATFVAGKKYFILIRYSNTIFNGAKDIDGCTLFAYEGGGSTSKIAPEPKPPVAVKIRRPVNGAGPNVGEVKSARPMTTLERMVNSSSLVEAWDIDRREGYPVPYLGEKYLHAQLEYYRKTFVKVDGKYRIADEKDYRRWVAIDDNAAAAVRRAGGYERLDERLQAERREAARRAKEEETWRQEVAKEERARRRMEEDARSLAQGKRKAEENRRRIREREQKDAMAWAGLRLVFMDAPLIVGSIALTLESAGGGVPAMFVAVDLATSDLATVFSGGKVDRPLLTKRLLMEAGQSEEHADGTVFFFSLYAGSRVEPAGRRSTPPGTAAKNATPTGQAAAKTGKVGAASKNAPKKTWQDFLPEARKRLEAAKAKYGNTDAMMMAMSRKDALKRINGLSPKVEEHLAKIANNPASRDVPHWTTETNSWIKQIEDVLPHVGDKTAAEWLAKIAEWKAKLGN